MQDQDMGDSKFSIIFKKFNEHMNSSSDKFFDSIDLDELKEIDELRELALEVKDPDITLDTST